MNTELKHDIYIDWELAGANPYKPLLTRVITAALAAENVTIPCSVDVLLTTDEGIREINQEQRNIDQATDVLSFPMLELTPGTPPDGTGEDEQDPETGLCSLGDMVISVDRAKAQAAAQTEFITSGPWDGDQLVYFTCLPWFPLTALKNEKDVNPSDSVPRAAWGRWEEEGSRTRLLLSLELNHRLLDGVHVGRFYEALNRWMEGL